MAIDIPETVPNCEFKSTVCKALEKLLGNSPELEEFDKKSTRQNLRDNPCRQKLRCANPWLNISAE